MAPKEYSLLPGDSQESLQKVVQENLKLPNVSRRLFLVLSFFSLLANLILGIEYVSSQSEKINNSKSKYAGLQWNVPIPWTHEGPFASHNRSILDAAWETIDEDIGLVALGDDFAKEKGLPPAQRYPWDESKGLYLLKAYHNLHCLNIFRESLMEMHDKVPQTQHFRHLGHCLEAFRQDIICNADDTPRYTGSSMLPTTGPTSGLGQEKMCRSWDQLD